MLTTFSLQIKHRKKLFWLFHPSPRSNINSWKKRVFECFRWHQSVPPGKWCEGKCKWFLRENNWNFHEIGMGITIISRYVLPHWSNSVPSCNWQDKRGCTQREALATRSIDKNLEQTFPIVNPQYWCQNYCIDGGLSNSTSFEQIWYHYGGAKRQCQVEVHVMTFSRI